MVTCLYCTGLVALAAAPREMNVDPTIARMPDTNIGTASFSIVLRLLILSPFGFWWLKTRPDRRQRGELAKHLGSG